MYLRSPIKYDWDVSLTVEKTYAIKFETDSTISFWKLIFINKSTNYESTVYDVLVTLPILLETVSTPIQVPIEAIHETSRFECNWLKMGIS